jgi:hypothetical protein
MRRARLAPLGRDLAGFDPQEMAVIKHRACTNFVQRCCITA